MEGSKRGKEVTQMTDRGRLFKRTSRGCFDPLTTQPSTMLSIVAGFVPVLFLPPLLESKRVSFDISTLSSIFLGYAFYPSTELITCVSVLNFSIVLISFFFVLYRLQVRSFFMGCFHTGLRAFFFFFSRTIVKNLGNKCSSWRHINVLLISWGDF